MKVSQLIAIPILMLAAARGLAQDASASAGQPAKVVIGKLGQALKPTTIYSQPTSRSHAYYRSKAYEYLVVRTLRSPVWLGVVLKNGMVGYVKAANVATLPYLVKADAAPQRGASVLGSRSGAAVAGMNFIGTPYKWGGNDVLNGIDCSGFVKKMYGSIGIDLPRTAAQQALVGTPITRIRDLQAGDRLYFWDAKRGKIGHTGMYLGNDYFVHASSGHHGVATDFLGSPKWMKILVAARR